LSAAAEISIEAVAEMSLAALLVNIN